MDYVTKSWRLTHREAEATLSASASIKAGVKFLADAKVDTGISIRGLGAKAKSTACKLSISLPSGHRWVIYHGRRYIQDVENGYHCHSLTSHYKVHTAKRHSFSAVNHDDTYRCDIKPKDGLAKPAISKGC
ncbi:hypothetical protein ACIQU5_31455 [Streptomyces sp. NPDC090306]|uniref:hypothetical protein n=1 Tax=Streptomyces sp. NPDC090306 TaxID=3365961 RepID=UPI0037F553E7